MNRSNQFRAVTTFVFTGLLILIVAVAGDGQTAKNPSTLTADSLENTTFQLLKHSTFYCEKTTFTRLGLQMSESNPVIKRVIPNSPADEAGLTAGDRITAIGHSSETSTHEKIDLGNVDSRLKKLAGDGFSFPITYRSDGSEKQTQIKPVETCDYHVKVVDGSEKNIHLDNRTLEITSSLFDSLDKKIQLITILSHQLGHSMLEHKFKRRRNAIAGTVVDLGASAMGVPTMGLFGYAGHSLNRTQREQAADALGLYVMARADVSYWKSKSVWKQLRDQREDPWLGEQYMRNHVALKPIVNTHIIDAHPVTSERLTWIDKTVQTIRGKQRRGEPLTPGDQLFPDSQEPPMNETVSQNTSPRDKTTIASPGEDPSSKDVKATEEQIASSTRDTNAPEIKPALSPDVDTGNQTGGDTQPSFENDKNEPKVRSVSKQKRGIDTPTTSPTPRISPNADTLPKTATNGQQNDDKNSVEKDTSVQLTSAERTHSDSTAATSEPQGDTTINTTANDGAETNALKTYYTIQLISVGSKQRARNFLQTINEEVSGLRIRESSVNGKVYYRVRAGVHPTRKSARNHARKIEKIERVPENYWISRVRTEGDMPSSSGM